MQHAFKTTSQLCVVYNKDDSHGPIIKVVLVSAIENAVKWKWFSH